MLGQARLKTFYDLPNCYFSTTNAIQTTQIGTIPPMVESTRVSRTSDFSTSDTLPVTGNVYSENKVNRRAAYLTKSAVKEALEELMKSKRQVN